MKISLLSFCLGFLSIQKIALAFRFVYIPCDITAPMDDWHLHPKSKDDEIGCLTMHLQNWYARAGRLSNEQKQNFKGHLRMHATVSDRVRDIQKVSPFFLSEFRTVQFSSVGRQGDLGTQQTRF